MMSNAEYTQVEKPLLEQLAAMDYRTLVGDKYDPSLTERDNFREVILEGRLRSAIKNLNPGPDNQPWLDDARVSEAVSALTRPAAGKLLEINEHMTTLLL